MTGITWTNMKEVMAAMEARQKKLEDAPKMARKMGVLALNEIHPITHKRFNTWDSSIHAEVHQISSFKWELWVGSKGAFASPNGGEGSKTDNGGYNYGKRQEDLYHPIEIGWHKAQPTMTDLWNEFFHGIVTANAAGMSDFAGLDVSEW